MDVECEFCHIYFVSQALCLLHAAIVHPDGAISQSQTASALNGVDNATSATDQSQSLVIYERSSAMLARVTTSLATGCAMQQPAFLKALYEQSYQELVAIQGLISSTKKVERLLAHSYEIKARLQDLSHRLGRGDDHSMWAAFNEDDAQVLLLLRGLLDAPSGVEAVMSLRDNVSEADAFLNLVEEILYNGRFNSGSGSANMDAAEVATFRKRLRRISVRLAEATDQLPSSIHLEGVHVHEKLYPVSGGAFADIYRGQLAGREIAVKRLRITLYQTSSERARTFRAFCRESLIWQHLDHQNVLPFLGVDQETFNPCVCMVSPWMQHGNIHDFITSAGFVPHEIDRLLSEVADGLAYLHDENVAHGDLRGPNVLVDDDRHARLADFGLANFADSTSASVSSPDTGAIAWMAPELIDPESFGLHSSRPSRASDVYAFGCFSWEVYNGYPPFHDLKFSRALREITSGRRPLRSSASRELPDILWETIEACWEQQPLGRPTAVEVFRSMRKNRDPKPTTSIIPPVSSPRPECTLPVVSAVSNVSLFSGCFDSGVPGNGILGTDQLLQGLALQTMQHTNAPAEQVMTVTRASLDTIDVFSFTATRDGQDYGPRGISVSGHNLEQDDLQVLTIGNLIHTSNVGSGSSSLEGWTPDSALLAAMSSSVQQMADGSPSFDIQGLQQDQRTDPTTSSLDLASTHSPDPPRKIKARALRLKRSGYGAGWTVSPRVLLVDDDAVSRRLSRRFLQVFGCTIDVAVDGLSAVDKMNLEKYDLVLMDIMMPKLDGISATSLIRRFDHMTPIISMTSNSSPNDITNYYLHGMTDVLPKPFTKGGLLDMLEKHLLHLMAIQTVLTVPRSVATISSLPDMFPSYQPLDSSSPKKRSRNVRRRRIVEAHSVDTGAALTDKS